MYERPISRAIRITTADLSGLTATILDRSTRVAAITVTPNLDDLVVDFRNNTTGEILWTIEADAGSGSHSVNFGPYPLLFTQGIVAEINKADSLQSICVAVVEPQAQGS